MAYVDVENSLCVGCMHMHGTFHIKEGNSGAACRSR